MNRNWKDWTYIFSGHELDLDVEPLSRHERASGGHDLEVARLALIHLVLATQVHGNMLISLASEQIQRGGVLSSQSLNIYDNNMTKDEQYSITIIVYSIQSIFNVFHEQQPYERSSFQYTVNFLYKMYVFFFCKK